MDTNVSPWKANLNSGVIIALIGIVWTLGAYFMDVLLSPAQGYVYLVVFAVLLFIFVKSYRDNHLGGFMTYGQALGAGVIIALYAAIIGAVFAYILYTVIDPGLIEKTLAITEQKLIDKGMPEAAIEQGMSINKKIMTPPIMAAMSIVQGVFMSFLIMLILSIFLKKEGNPLIDSAEE